MPTTEPSAWRDCDNEACERGAVLLPDPDAPGETMWTRCMTCRGTGEVYDGEDMMDAGKRAIEEAL